MTGAERKAFAAEVGRLIPLLKKDSGFTVDSDPESRWLLELSEKSGIGKTALYEWWSAFCKDAGLKLTPKQVGKFPT